MKIPRKSYIALRMRIAVIDMGTNTFHLLIAEVNGTSYSVLHKERAVVRIGHQGIQDGWIALDAQTRALNTLVEFKKRTKEFNVARIFATATSAIRSAANGLDLVRMIKETTDIDVKIISGQEEATHIYHGARRAVDISSGSYLIMDIGGGSIEFIIAKDGEAMWMESFEIGGQRLIDEFHKNDPITFGEIENLENYFEKTLARLHEACITFQPTTLLGCSGTFDTLSSIYCKETGKPEDQDATDLPISMDHYHELHSRLITYNRGERLAIAGMIEMRVDMIVVASVLISYLLRRYDLSEMRASAYALKEGVLYDILDHLDDSKSIKKL